VTITLNIEGVTAALGRFASYESGVQRGITSALDRSALAIQTGVRRALSQAGTGRLYKRRSVTHRASAPGQAPATDTGRLRASYALSSPGVATREVGTNVRYAPFLEYGTRRMAARPHLLPAYEAEKPRFIAAVQAALQPGSRTSGGTQ